MPAETTAASDLSMLDCAESITLRLRGSAVAVTLTGARLSSTSRETEPSNGAVVSSDTDWLLSNPEGGVDAAPGDQIIDAAGDCWTVLAVTNRPLGAGLRCSTRSLAILHGLSDLVTIEQARWHDTGDGPEVASWEPIRPAVAARIQPIETTINGQATPPMSIRRYRILLADDLPLDHNRRIIGPDGSVYRIVRYTQPERIDALAVAETEIDTLASV